MYAQEFLCDAVQREEHFEDEMMILSRCHMLLFGYVPTAACVLCLHVQIKSLRVLLVGGYICVS